MTTLKERIEWVLEHRGITAHAWSVSAGLASAHVSMMLTGRSKDPRRATIEKLARAARVRTEWLMFGTGDPESVDEPPPLELLSPSDDHGVDEPATQDVPLPSEMPETLGQRRDYARQEASAKKELAKRGESVEEWVWPHVRATNNFTLENSAPGVAMLCELAKFIASFGDPSMKAKGQKK